MKKALRVVLLHVAIVGLLCGYTFLIGCPVYRFAEIQCPFCGMTRAHLAFFRGDFKAALEFHSLFFLGIPFVAGLAHLRVLKKHRRIFIGVMLFEIGSMVAFMVRYIFLFLKS